MTSDGHWTENEELVEEYVLGRIEVPVREKLDAHLASCPHCRKLLEEEAILASGVRQFAGDRTREQLQALIKGKERDIPWPHILSMAAALFLIIGIGFYNRWFLRPIQHSPPLEAVEGKQKGNAGRGISQSAETDEGSELTSTDVDTSAFRDKKSIDTFAAKEAPSTAPSAILADRRAEKAGTFESRQHLLTGFLFRQRPDQLGKSVTQAEQESAGGAATPGAPERNQIVSQQEVKRTGNLVIHWRADNGNDGTAQTGQVRCSIEQIDTLFHLTIFLDPVMHIKDPLQVRVTLAAPDSLVLLLDRSQLGLGLPDEFKGLIVPAD